MASTLGQTVPGAYPPTYPPAVVQDGFTCRCTSTSRLPRSAAAPLPQTTYLSLNPEKAVNWMGALNPNLPRDASFVCSCKPVATGAVAENYLMSAYQTDPDGVSAAECLGESSIQTLCVALEDMALFHCETVWRSGLAGKTADNLLRDDVLLEAVHKLSAARGVPCARTIRFRGAIDAPLAAFRRLQAVPYRRPV